MMWKLLCWFHCLKVQKDFIVFLNVIFWSISKVLVFHIFQLHEFFYSTKIHFWPFNYWHLNSFLKVQFLTQWLRCKYFQDLQAWGSLVVYSPSFLFSFIFLSILSFLQGLLINIPIFFSIISNFIFFAIESATNWDD